MTGSIFFANDNGLDPIYRFGVDLDRKFAVNFGTTASQCFPPAHSQDAAMEIKAFGPLPICRCISSLENSALRVVCSAHPNELTSNGQKRDNRT